MLSSSISQRAIGFAHVLFVAALLLCFLSLSASPVRAQAPAPTAGSYWICRVIPGDGTSYYSDIFAAPVNAYSDMAKGFTQFLAAKYNQKNGVPTCISYVLDQQAQTNMKQFAAGAKSILTGWKYGQAAAPTAPTASSAPSQPPASPLSPASAPVPAPAAQAPPASTTIAMRMVDLVNSATDPAGKQYRAVVTQAAEAGSVAIPVNTPARIALAKSGDTWSAQLVFLSLNGQMVPVTSSAVSAASPVQQELQKAKSVFSSLGGVGKNVSPSAAVATAIASGDHVFLPVGALLTFTTSVPQPAAQASSGSPIAPSPAPAATGGTPVVARNMAGQGNVVAPQTGGGSAGMCEFTGNEKYYYSAIFDAPNDNDKYKWEQAWVYYVLHQVDSFPGSGYCAFYRTRAAAQRDLQVHKDQLGAKLTETGWVYTGPEQLPPPPPPNPGHGK